MRTGLSRPTVVAVWALSLVVVAGHLVPKGWNSEGTLDSASPPPADDGAAAGGPSSSAERRQWDELSIEAIEQAQAASLGRRSIRCVLPVLDGPSTTRVRLLGVPDTELPNPYPASLRDGEVFLHVPSGSGRADLVVAGFGRVRVGWAGAAPVGWEDCTEVRLVAGHSEIHGHIRGWVRPLGVSAVVAGCGGESRPADDGTFTITAEAGPCSLRVDHIDDEGRSRGRELPIAPEPGLVLTGVVLDPPEEGSWTPWTPREWAGWRRRACLGELSEALQLHAAWVAVAPTGAPADLLSASRRERRRLAGRYAGRLARCSTLGHSSGPGIVSETARRRSVTPPPP